MAYVVRYTKTAVKALSKLPEPLAASIRTATTSLAENPRPHGAKKLTARDNYRIRVGDYRIVYTIKDNILLVEIIMVGHRSDIYRRLT
ncbi:MAG: type II toxin-antitoxin system RelE/ParE family toxin [Propionibacteriaceae bacterium]|nr:type II toxin-antitoxin system RelE/ParE family toxin [Propionibacteriaceae bacterium]